MDSHDDCCYAARKVVQQIAPGAGFEWKEHAVTVIAAALAARPAQRAGGTREQFDDALGWIDEAIAWLDAQKIGTVLGHSSVLGGLKEVRAALTPPPSPEAVHRPGSGGAKPNIDPSR